MTVLAAVISVSALTLPVYANHSLVNKEPEEEKGFLHDVPYTKDEGRKDDGAIYDANDLLDMEDDGDYYLACDIDLTGIEWNAIKGFSGSLDGKGYEIHGLTSDKYGLFSTLETGAEISNVILSDVKIISKYKTVGAIASLIQSDEEDITISNCYVSGVVASCGTKFGRSTKSMVGSIVGYNYSDSTVIENCYSTALVASERNAGGIIGGNKGIVKNSGFGGAIKNSRHVYQLVVNDGEVMNDEYCYLNSVGGICSFNYGEITDCFTVSKLEGVNNYIEMDIGKYNGGIVGANQTGGIVKNCVNSLDILKDSYSKEGLIAGFSSSKGKITDCYTKNSSNKKVTDNSVGKGKTKGTVKIGEKAFVKIKNYKKLDGKWAIVGGTPIIYSLKPYVINDAVYAVINSSLKKLSEGHIIPMEEREASIDYGYSPEGDLLE